MSFGLYFLTVDIYYKYKASLSWVAATNTTTNSTTNATPTSTDGDKKANNLTILVVFDGIDRTF